MLFLRASKQLCHASGEDTSGALLHSRVRVSTPLPEEPSVGSRPLMFFPESLKSGALTVEQEVGRLRTRTLTGCLAVAQRVTVHNARRPKAAQRSASIADLVSSEW